MGFNLPRGKIQRAIKINGLAHEGEGAVGLSSILCSHFARRGFSRAPGVANQPPEGLLMAEHKFKAGQRVKLAASAMSRRAASGGYVVIRQLPERSGEFEYRIKSVSEPHERVARESELVSEWPP
jgi:hypothetical protein